MWITTYHRFTNRAEFLAACQTVGWICPPGQDPEPPQGVAVDIVGPIIASAHVGEGGVPIAGDVIDPCYHVNLAWHAQEMHSAFVDSQTAPATPSRAFGLPPAPPAAPAVPATILAWKGKAALREAGLLDAVEVGVEVAGGRVRDAWAGASEWSRDSDFLLSLAVGLGLTKRQIDDMFRLADGIRS